MRRARTLVSAFLIVLQLLAAASPALAADGWVGFTEKVEANAGGWNAATPLIVGGVAIAQDLAGHRDFEADRLLNRRFLGGMAGDVGLLVATRFALMHLPLPGPAKILAMTAAGFLGWEAGTSGFQDTDWVKTGAEIAAATLVQIGLPILLASAGLAAPGIVVMAAAIGASLGAALLVDWLRRGGLSGGGDGRRLLDDRWRAPGPDSYAGLTDFVSDGGDGASSPSPPPEVTEQPGPSFAGLELHERGRGRNQPTP